VPYEEVQGVFKADLGIDPMDVFETFSHEALASASIAQVHRATLKPEAGNPDRVVAVKVQKPAIAKQMEWDLFSYRWVPQRGAADPAGVSCGSLRRRLIFLVSDTVDPR